MDTPTRLSVGIELTPDAEHARLYTSQGASVIETEGVTYEETAAALKLLRGFRAVGRRFVFCDTDRLIASRQLGGELVQLGGANVLVSCGQQGRDVAIGARDAGLDLSNVVVCRDAGAAAELLSCQLAASDTVLLLGVERQTCQRLLLLLEQRAVRPLSAAA